MLFAQPSAVFIKKAAAGPMLPEISIGAGESRRTGVIVNNRLLALNLVPR
eukprot:SAG11_NODE_176_length_13359_cov_10.862142_2_plen_50_part_00